MVILSDGEIGAATLVWTAGTAPNPLLKSLAVERDLRGAVVVEDTLAVNGHRDLWALGDCAAVSDAKTRQNVPAHRPVRTSSGGGVGEKYPRPIGGPPRTDFSFRFSGSNVRCRPPDGLRRIDRALCSYQIRTFFRVACLADYGAASTCRNFQA